MDFETELLILEFEEEIAQYDQIQVNLRATFPQWFNICTGYQEVDTWAEYKEAVDIMRRKTGISEEVQTVTNAVIRKHAYNVNNGVF